MIMNGALGLNFESGDVYLEGIIQVFIVFLAHLDSQYPAISG